MKQRSCLALTAVIAICACSSEPPALRESRVRWEAALNTSVPLGSTSAEIGQWAAANEHQVSQPFPGSLHIELDKVDPGTGQGFCGPVSITAVVALNEAGKSKKQGVTWSSTCQIVAPN